MIGVTNKCNTEIFMGKFQLPLTFVCFNNCTEEEFPAIRKAFQNDLRKMIETDVEISKFNFIDFNDPFNKILLQDPD